MSSFLRRSLPMICHLALGFMLCAMNLAHAASEEKLNYQQARKALSDAQPAVRQVALATVWRLWGKSGDAAIDKLYQEGLDRMQDGDMPKAIKVFSDIIAKRPAFAEAWNKRATIYYMTGEYELSMQDCEEVIKRLPEHFGALVGYAQMLAERSQPERALALMERASKINPYLANAELMMAALRIQIENKRKNMI